MKKLLLGLVALVGTMTASAAETVLWEGNQKLEYNGSPKIEASKCQAFEAGGFIVNYYEISGSDYTALGMIPGSWGDFPGKWGATGAVPAGSTMKTSDPLTQDVVDVMKNVGFMYMGHSVTLKKVTYKTPEGPVDPSIVLRDPVTISTESGSVEISYEAIVAAGGVVGGGVQVDYTGMEGKQYYIDFLHQGTADNQYTWAQFTDKIVTETEGRSILHLNETTLEELGSFSKMLIIQGGYVNVTNVKVLKPSEMPDAPTPDPEVTLDKAELELFVGASATLKATIVPANAAITWTSSDAAVATVDAAGKVTAVAAGTATVKAAIEGAFAECVVTVKEKAPASIKATDKDGEPIESYVLWVGDPSPYIFFPTEPADAKVTIKLQDVTPAGSIKMYDYKPGYGREWYNCNFTVTGNGTATVVAYITDDPEVKVEVPIIAKDYTEPTFALKPWSSAINQDKVSPGQAPYEMYAAFLLPGGDFDWDIFESKDVTYTWTTSDAEIATVKTGIDPDYAAVAAVEFTGNPGSVTIGCKITLTDGTTAEATTDFTVLSYGEVKYTFDFYNTGWKEAYGFPAESSESITDFNAVGKNVDMYLSNAIYRGSAPSPAEGSYFEFKVTNPNVRILGIGGSPAPSTPARITFADKVTVDTGSVDGSAWTPDAADAKTGVESVRFTCTANVYSLCFWNINLMYYAPADIALDATEAALKEGDTKQLTATISGEHILPNGKTVWSSSDETVATVDAEGLVTAVAEGEAVITADYAGSKATCTVTVEKQNSIFDIDADNNEPAEFFNLQGIRVSNPEAGGVYIRRQGNKVTKVIVK